MSEKHNQFSKAHGHGKYVLCNFKGTLPRITAIVTLLREWLFNGRLFLKINGRKKKGIRSTLIKCILIKNAFNARTFASANLNDKVSEYRMAFRACIERKHIFKIWANQCHHKIHVAVPTNTENMRRKQINVIHTFVSLCLSLFGLYYFLREPKMKALRHTAYPHQTRANRIR